MFFLLVLPTHTYTDAKRVLVVSEMSEDIEAMTNWVDSTRAVFPMPPYGFAGFSYLGWLSPTQEVFWELTLEWTIVIYPSITITKKRNNGGYEINDNGCIRQYLVYQ